MMTKAKKTISKNKGTTSTARKSNNENIKKTQAKLGETAKIGKETSRGRSKKGGGSVSEQLKVSRSNRTVRENTPKGKQVSKSVQGELKIISSTSPVESAELKEESNEVIIEEEISEKKDEKKSNRRKKSVIEHSVSNEVSIEEEIKKKDSDSLEVSISPDDKVTKYRRRKLVEVRAAGRAKAVMRVKKPMGTDFIHEPELIQENKEMQKEEKPEEAKEHEITVEEKKNMEETHDKKETSKYNNKKRDSQRSYNRRTNKKENKKVEVMEDKKEETVEKKEEETKENLLNDKKEEMVQVHYDKGVIQNLKEDIIKDINEEAIKDTKEEILEDKKEEILEDKKEEIMEDKKEEILEDKKEEILKNKIDLKEKRSKKKKEKSKEDKKEESIEHKKEKPIEHKKEESIEHKKEESIEHKKEEPIEHTKEESVEHTKEEPIEHKKEEQCVKVMITENPSEVNSVPTSNPTTERAVKGRGSGRRKKTPTSINIGTQKTIQKQTTQKTAKQKPRRSTPRKSYTKKDNESQVPEELNEIKENEPVNRVATTISIEEKPLLDKTLDVQKEENEKDDKKEEKGNKRKSVSPRARQSRRKVTTNKTEKENNMNNKLTEEENKIEEENIEKIEIDKNKVEKKEITRKNEKKKQNKNRIEKEELNESMSNEVEIDKHIDKQKEEKDDTINKEEQEENIKEKEELSQHTREHIKMIDDEDHNNQIVDPYLSNFPETHKNTNDHVLIYNDMEVTSEINIIEDQKEEQDNNRDQKKELSKHVGDKTETDQSVYEEERMDISIHEKEEINNTLNEKEESSNKKEEKKEQMNKKVDVDHTIDEEVELVEILNDKSETYEQNNDKIEIDNNTNETIESEKSINDKIETEKSKTNKERNSFLIKNASIDKKCETRYFDSISVGKSELGDILDKDDFYSKKVSQTTIDNCINDQEEVVTDSVLMDEEILKNIKESNQIIEMKEVSEQESISVEKENTNLSSCSSNETDKLLKMEENVLVEVTTKANEESGSLKKEDVKEFQRTDTKENGSDILDEEGPVEEDNISSPTVIDKKRRGRKRKEIKNILEESSSSLTKEMKIGKIHKKSVFVEPDESDKKETIKETSSADIVMSTSSLRTTENKYKYFLPGMQNRIEHSKGRDTMKKSASGEYVQLKEKDVKDGFSVNKILDSLVPVEEDPVHDSLISKEVTSVVTNHSESSIMPPHENLITTESTAVKNKMRDGKSVGVTNILPTRGLRRKRRSSTGRRKYVRKRSGYELSYNNTTKSRKLNGESLLEYKNGSINKMHGRMIPKDRLFPKENFMSKYEFMNNMNYINTVFHFDIEFFHFLNTVKNCNDINYESMLSFLNEIQIMLLKDIQVEYPQQCLTDHNVKDTVHVMKHLVRILNSNNVMLSMLNHVEFKFFKDFLRKRKERDNGISTDINLQSVCENISSLSSKESFMQNLGVYNEESQTIENKISSNCDSEKDSFDNIVECLSNEMDTCIRKTLKEEEQQQMNLRNSGSYDSVEIAATTSLKAEPESSEIHLHKEYVSTKVYKNITVVQPQVQPQIPPPQVHHLPQLRTFSLRGVHNTITASMNEKNEKKVKKEEHATEIKKEEPALYGASEFSKFEDLFRKANDLQLHEENETTRSGSNEKNLLYSMETLRTYEDVEIKDGTMRANETQPMKENKIGTKENDNTVEENGLKIESVVKEVEKENSGPIDKCDSEHSLSNNNVAVKSDEATDTLPSMISGRDAEDYSSTQPNNTVGIPTATTTLSECTYTNLKNELLTDNGKEVSLCNNCSDTTHSADIVNPNTLYHIHSKNMSICNDNSIMDLLKKTFHLEDDEDCSNSLKTEKTEKEILECLNMISKIKKTLFDECTRMINNEIIRLEKNFKIINCGLTILSNNTTSNDSYK